VANSRWSIVTTGTFSADSTKTTQGLDGITYNRYTYKKVEKLADDGHILAVKKTDIASFIGGTLADDKIMSLNQADGNGELVGTEIIVTKDVEGKITEVSSSGKSIVGALTITEKDGKYTAKIGDKIYLENADSSSVLSPLVYSYAYSGLGYFSSLNKLRVYVNPDTFVDLHKIYSNGSHSVSEVGSFYNEFYNVRRAMHEVIGYDWDYDGKLDAVILSDGTVAKIGKINEAEINLRSNATNAGYCGHGWCTGPTIRLSKVALNCSPKVDVHVLAYGDYKTGKIYVDPVTEIVGTLTAIDWEKGTCIIDGNEYEICIGGETPYGYSANPYRWASKELEKELMGNKVKVYTDGEYVVHFVETALEKAVPLADDSEFVQKNIFTADLYQKGIKYERYSATEYRITFDSKLDSYAIVLPVTLGKCYEVRFNTLPEKLGVVRITVDPYNQKDGNYYNTKNNILCLSGAPKNSSESNFMHVPQRDEYMVIVTGNKLDDVFIGEQTIVAEGQSKIDWWVPAEQGSIKRGDSNLMGDIDWTSEEFIDNMYEPVRAAHPDYITRNIIGKDQSGQYNMYSYVYTPENYKTTFLLASGIHGNEEPSYFALAKLMELIANADESDKHLYYLRQNVRFVVIPLMNPWSVSQDKNIRQNSTGTDMNRDFPNLTQKETQNIMAEFRKYANEATLLMDFHCSSNTKTSDLYYNFAIQADNAHIIFRTLNQLHHRQKQLGYVEKLQAIAYVPGVYIKTNTTLQGRAYNEFGISTITAEHFMSTTGFPDGFTAKGMTHAVEAFGNMIIQNAYYYVEKASK